MWALVESGSVSKVYTRPKQLTIGDVQYPKNIFSLWTKAELETLDIYDVVSDNTNLKDLDYYKNTDQTFAFQSSVTINSIDYTNVVVASYGTATAKPLADSGSGETLVRGGSVASAWTTYRAAVRTAAASMVTKINAVSDVDALAALYVYNDATPPVRPLGNFPDVPTS